MNVLEKLLGTTSPFKQLFEHLEKTLECVELVEPLIEVSLAGNKSEQNRICLEIFKLEHEADEIKHDIRDNLPRDLFMPVSRSDFISFLREQDNIADKCEDLAMMISIKKLNRPDDKEFDNTLRKLASRSIEAVKLVSQMTFNLKSLKEAGFKGPLCESIRDAAIEVGDLEFKADKHQYRLVRTLLSIESKEWRFMETFTWMQIIRSLGGMADHAEKMADYIRLMIAE